MVEAPSFRLPFVVGVVLILLGGGAASFFVYLNARPAASAGARVALEGDNVSVNYIGIFGSGPDAGKVFDTSLYAVASNNALWPKSLEYQGRGGAGNYSPLDVHVGPTTPSGGYSLGGKSYIQVVTGFWQGLVGLRGNFTRAVFVPPALGYGAENPGCIVQRPLLERMPVLLTMTRAQFGSAYPGTVPNTGASFLDPHYHWPVLVLSSNATSVTVENLAHVGDTASPSGWPVTVTNVTSTSDGSGQITLLNELAPADAGRVLGTDFTSSGPCNQQSHGQFIVTAVDLAGGTYTADFNSEVTGQTLVFLVTIVDIHRP